MKCSKCKKETKGTTLKVEDLPETTIDMCPVCYNQEEQMFVEGHTDNNEFSQEW